MESLKLISWNVNGLRAVVGKGFDQVFKDLDADCFCIQETKLKEGQIDLAFEGYESYWDYADRPGYAGTTIFTRIKPLSVSYGLGHALGHDSHDHEGRAVTLEFDDFFLVNVYVPNSQDGLKRLDYRMKWDADLREYLKGLEQRKPVVMCGDLNVAHQEIDLKNPATNHFSAGFSDEERDGMSKLLAEGFVDSWRYQHPQEVKYSWWSYRAAARQRNVGWRIDYFIVSEALKSRIVSTEIHDQILGSDHCPVELCLGR